MRLFLYLSLFCVSLAVPAQATVLLNFTASTQTAAPGDTITFSGSITNNYASAVDLNNISINLAGWFSSDGSPFFDISAPLSVNANDTTVIYDWFTVTVNDPYPDPLGLVSGTFSVLGGIQINSVYDPTAQDLLATQAFSVDVIAPGGTSAVPEPAPAGLLCVGALALAALRRIGGR
jgi:hypothetical protein